MLVSFETNAHSMTKDCSHSENLVQFRGNDIEDSDFTSNVINSCLVFNAESENG